MYFLQNNNMNGNHSPRCHVCHDLQPGLPLHRQGDLSPTALRDCLRYQKGCILTAASCIHVHVTYACSSISQQKRPAHASQPAHLQVLHRPVMARFSIWVYGTSFQSPSSVAGSHTNRHNYFIQPSFPTTESCKRGGSRGHACLEHQTLVRYPSSHCRSLSRSGTLQCARLFRS